MSKKYSMTTDDGHFVRVIVGNHLITIVEYYLDPEEGDVNIHNHVTLSYDEMAWIVDRWRPSVPGDPYGPVIIGGGGIIREVVPSTVIDALEGFTPVGAHTEYGDIIFDAPLGFAVPPVHITMEDDDD